eukprot:6069632-Ditylum_brightwellii.AAC.1
MLEYYRNLQRQEVDVKRKYLMFIWSFKGKDMQMVRYPNTKLDYDVMEDNNNGVSIDFVLAYPQAEIKNVIYLHPPVGVIINNHGQDLVLKIKKNLYGLKDAERTWQEHLSSGIEEMGFKQCVADQCIWNRDGIIIIVYVDDCLVFGNDKEKVDEVVMEISK